MDLIIPVASLVIAFRTLLFTTLMLRHQSRQMEHERNALAILEAVDRLTSSHVVAVFNQLRGIEQRYPTDADIKAKFFGSEDERARQFVETIATLARREVLDATLLCDAVGWTLRQRWDIVEKFVAHWRRYNNNEFSLRKL